jgi:hypothetical protein
VDLEIALPGSTRPPPKSLCATRTSSALIERGASRCGRLALKLVQGRVRLHRASATRRSTEAHVHPAPPKRRAIAGRRGSLAEPWIASLRSQ